MMVVDQLKGRDFLCLSDYTKDEILYLLDLAAKLKEEQKQGILHPHLAGKTLGMIFDKASTRTRVSFEVGMYQLGGMAMFMSGRDLQIGRGEPIPDTARVLSRYLDGIMIRTFSDKMVKELADYASIPIINGLTDMQHPCQVMADFQTIIEHKGRLEGLKLAYVGDGNNMTHSLMIGAAKVGMDVAVASPEGYMPDAGVTEMTRKFAEETGVHVLVTNDPAEAVAGADIVYTDVWASMGQEAEQQERLQKFAGFEVNEALMRKAKPDAIFMHCLPAHRGEEVSAEVIDGPRSVVFDQSENRLHAQKAILVALMK
ncbi:MULTISPECIES: ornithine carbamoyltransferase [Aneurinibacillus]|jgi:ornithine carbamoyltransferase|uniref:Ornithine carbamoyltransferase n=1 Tax=Aneurinibacillus danicus TaxID=267746 RepID=A0A511VFP1_9BACL|nr:MULTISPECIES: ornithine carbamoyltransferase [Aneurinibacillus]GEN36042.1 ornithine carbamoyltransferase [Aneurinibacillus danicus]